MDDAQVRDAVERMAAHVVRALSRGDLDAYEAAFHLPGVGVQPERGADGVVLTSLLANWARWVSLLFEVDSMEAVVAIPPRIRPAVLDLLAAGAAGDTGRLDKGAAASRVLPDEDLWHLLYAFAASYTTLVQLFGGLDRLAEIHYAADLNTGPDEQELGAATVLVVAAVGADNWVAAGRILHTVANREKGAAALATMFVITVKTAARVLAAGPAGPAADAGDARFPTVSDAVGLPEPAVRVVRQAIAGHLGHPGAPPPAQWLRLPDTAHGIAAVLYAAQTLIGQLPAAVQHYVDTEAAALDPDHR